MAEAGRRSLRDTRAGFPEYEVEAARVRALSREGRLDDATRVAFESAHMIEAMRGRIRTIEDCNPKFHVDAASAAAARYASSKIFLLSIAALGVLGGIGLGSWVV